MRQALSCQWTQLVVLTNPRSIHGQANADVESESGVAPLIVYPRAKKAI